MTEEIKEIVSNYVGEANDVSLSDELVATLVQIRDAAATAAVGVLIDKAQQLYIEILEPIEKDVTKKIEDFRAMLKEIL